jgi:uncharacterized membrane protein HdeD (DUF308 family)
MTTTASTQTKAWPWWVTLITGIAAIIVGILILTTPVKSTVVIVQFLGIYWLVSGIMSIVAMFVDHTAWGWKLFIGILGIIAGILIIQSPLWAAVLVPTTLVWVLGLEGIVIGIVALFQAFKGAGWGAGILGVLSIIFGIYLMGNALAGAVALVWIAGILGIVGGIYAIYLAFKQRS